MPPGVNAGNNLNIFIFEVGMLTRDPVLGLELVQTATIHPLVVVPSEVMIDDMSRSSVVETAGGAIMNVGGRGLRNISMSGTFGKESRGLLLYLGTGKVRYHRFYDEVVRMSDALNKDDVDEAIDILRGTPFVKLLVAPYDPERTVFFINYWDFFHEQSFSCYIKNFRSTFSHARGGASGMIHYQMQIQEVGPLVTGGIGTALINALFAVLTIWSAVNDVIASYTPGAIAQSVTGFAAIFVGQATATLDAISESIESLETFALDNPLGASMLRAHNAVNRLSVAATSLMGGKSVGQNASRSPAAQANEPQPSELQRYLPETRALRDSVLAVSAAVASSTTDVVEPAQAGAIGWNSESISALDSYDEQENLADMAESADFQAVAGVFAGMSRAQYQAFLSSGGAGLGPTLQGSVTHRVRAGDTEESLTLAYGVDWDTILDLNNLFPDEALLVGTVLQIPRPRGVSAQRIDGLPVFGSHAGRAAWGTDIDLEMRPAADGDLAVVIEEECLTQGMTWLLELFESDLLSFIKGLPDSIRAQALRARVERIFLTDKRITGVVDTVFSSQPGSFAAEIDVTIEAINGGTISTAAPRRG